MIDTLKFTRHMQTKGGLTQEAAEASAECTNEATSIDQFYDEAGFDDCRVWSSEAYPVCRARHCARCEHSFTHLNVSISRIGYARAGLATGASSH